MRILGARIFSKSFGGKIEEIQTAVTIAKHIQQIAWSIIRWKFSPIKQFIIAVKPRLCCKLLKHSTRVSSAR